MLSLKKYNIPWPVLFIEVVSIIIGVFLALGVNEWRAELKKEEQVNTAIHNITKELEYNRKELERSFQYHKQLYDTTSYLIDSVEVVSDFSFFGGIQPAVLQRSNYQAALNSNIFSYMDFDYAQHISQVYLLMDKIDEYMNLFLLAGLNNEFFLDSELEESLIFLNTAIKDIYSIEKAIKDQIDSTLESLDKYQK